MKNVEHHVTDRPASQDGTINWLTKRLSRLTGRDRLLVDIQTDVSYVRLHRTSLTCLAWPGIRLCSVIVTEQPYDRRFEAWRRS